MALLENKYIQVINLDRFDLKTCEANPSWLFVFGDNYSSFVNNDIKPGGGQACIRGHPRAFGIPTKMAAGISYEHFMNDAYLSFNKSIIVYAFEKIYYYLQNSNHITHIVFPKDGFGIGWAELDKRAPATFKFLNKKVEYYKNQFSVLPIGYDSESEDSDFDDLEFEELKV